MLNKLAKNQYVKIIKSNLENSDIEYGVVLNDENEKYDIMSIGFENKNGKFVEYPTNVENLVQSYTTQDAQFDEVKENEVIVSRKSDAYKNFHGTANANINNMIIGVTKGYEKKLEIVGVGYRFTAKGNTLVVNAGYSHPVEVSVPTGITIEVPSNTELFIRGIDKCLVGEFAAEVRKIRQPEPYKGKGIRYTDEHIRRKEGKKAA